MYHWQQTAFREQTTELMRYSFDAGFPIDAKVGLVCIACVFLVWVCGGF
jgi:hypothetical protein